MSRFWHNLRALGYPNPGQSFGRGMCGPEATGVKMWESVLGRTKCDKKKNIIPAGCVDVCRLRDGIISGASMAGTFRFLKFIDFSKKHAKSWNLEILRDVSIFAASMIFQKINCKKLKVWNPDGCVELCRLREGIILGPRMAGPSDLLKFIDFSKNHLFCNDFCNYIDVNIGGAAQTSWPYTP